MTVELTNERRAEFIVNCLRNLPTANARITRIQLMSGEWPDNEKDQGGFNMEALQRYFTNLLNKLEELEREAER